MVHSLNLRDDTEGRCPCGQRHERQHKKKTLKTTTSSYYSFFCSYVFFFCLRVSLAPSLHTCTYGCPSQCTLKRGKTTYHEQFSAQQRPLVGYLPSIPRAISIFLPGLAQVALLAVQAATNFSQCFRLRVYRCRERRTFVPALGKIAHHLIEEQVQAGRGGGVGGNGGMAAVVNGGVSAICRIPYTIPFSSHRPLVPPPPSPPRG